MTDKSGGPDACWPWLGKKNKKGYGSFPAKLCGVRKGRSAHRSAYMLEYGDPGHLVIDHICDNPACVNPRHLRAIDNVTNVMIGNGACAKHARKSECKRGHRLSGDNLLLDNGGYRQCRVCFRAAQSRWYWKNKLGLSADELLWLQAVASKLWYTVVPAKKALAL